MSELVSVRVCVVVSALMAEVAFDAAVLPEGNTHTQTLSFLPFNHSPILIHSH